MGKPSGSNVPLSRTESIGAGSETRGSETSQYPQEKKSTEIPQVVASEAKPSGLPGGVAGLQYGKTSR